MVKLFPRHEVRLQAAKSAEFTAVELLEPYTTGSDSVLMRMEPLDVSVASEDTRTFGVGVGPQRALVMPWMVAALRQLPQLSESLICEGGRRMQRALQIMHAVELAHNDVTVRFLVHYFILLFVSSICNTVICIKWCAGGCIYVRSICGTRNVHGACLPSFKFSHRSAGVRPKYLIKEGS